MIIPFSSLLSLPFWLWKICMQKHWSRISYNSVSSCCGKDFAMPNEDSSIQRIFHFFFTKSISSFSIIAYRNHRSITLLVHFATNTYGIIKVTLKTFQRELYLKKLYTATVARIHYTCSDYTSEILGSFLYFLYFAYV